MTHWRRRKRGAYQRRQGPAYVPCGDCSAGWVAVGKTGATRCWCYRRWRLQLEPEPPRPVKLPLPEADL